MIRKLALAVSALALTSCAYNEQLGRNQLLLVDDSALAASAGQAWVQLQQQTPASRDMQANARVRTVANRLLNAAGMLDAPWEIVVFDDPSVNAFVLPGRRMGVNIGLVRFAASDDQLAAVIGHEIAHATASHAAERASQNAAAGLVLAGAQGVAGDGQIAQAISAYGGAGAQLGYLLPFSRRHELEADRLGVNYMQAAGYDPRQAVVLWRRMAEAGGASGPQWGSTHPSDASRIQALEAYLRERGWS